MDSKRTCDPIDEFGRASRGKKLLKSPFHSYKALNSISWYNMDGAASCQVELKDILNSNVPVLATEYLLNGSIHMFIFIPLIELNNLSIFHQIS
jgi:hypothetical protein